MVVTLGLESLLEKAVFWQLCQHNWDRTGHGELVCMVPVGSEGSAFNVGVVPQLWLWHRRIGAVFDSAAEFVLGGFAPRMGLGSLVSWWSWQ
ncbi:MAG: hypothetical protein Q6J68_06570 [Thermostichales cyanobacterium SZTDM-1c_bins_54]